MLAETFSPVPFFQEIHKGNKGIIALATIREQAESERSFTCQYGKYSSLKKTIEKGTENLYFSLNTFSKFSRRVDNLLEITSCYLDIDYYNTGFSKEQILGNINIMVYDGEIPQPTFIVDSGRGLYMVWKLKRLPKEALPRWNTMQEYLYKQCKHLGADRKSLDASRIFRVDGSVNSKNGKEVQVLEHHAQCYDLHLITKKFLPQLYKTQQPCTKMNKASRKNVLYLFTTYSLYYNRMCDLARLCKLRNYDLKDYHCREMVLFLYRYYTCIYQRDEAVALESTLELNAQFKNPLPEWEVVKCTKSAEKAYKNKAYKYKNETLIELLGIDAEEQTFLSTIISREEKNTRQKEKKKAARRLEAGLTARQHKKLDTICMILDCKKQGLNQEETRKVTGLSIRTIKTYWKMKKESVNMWYKILVGKRKGEILLIDEIIEEEGVAITSTGLKVRLDQIAPLTKEEEEKCLKTVPIDLNA